MHAFPKAMTMMVLASISCAWATLAAQGLSPTVSYGGSACSIMGTTQQSLHVAGTCPFGTIPIPYSFDVAVGSGVLQLSASTSVPTGGSEYLGMNGSFTIPAGAHVCVTGGAACGTPGANSAAVSLSGPSGLIAYVDLGQPPYPKGASLPLAIIGAGTYRVSVAIWINGPWGNTWARASVNAYFANTGTSYAPTLNRTKLTSVQGGTGFANVAGLNAYFPPLTSGSIASSLTLVPETQLSLLLPPAQYQAINFPLPNHLVQAWDVNYGAGYPGFGALVIRYPDMLMKTGFRESELSLFQFVNNGWQPLPSQVDTWEHTIRSPIPGNVPVMVGAIPGSNAAARQSLSASDFVTGNSATVDVHGIAGDAFGVLIGADLGFVPFRPAAPLLLDLTTAMVLASGTIPPSMLTSLSLAMPPIPALIGKTVYLQGASLSPSSGLDLSNVLDRTVQ